MWTSRLADYSQRLVSVGLFGLTVYGLVVLTKGGKGVWDRRRNRKLAEAQAKK